MTRVRRVFFDANVFVTSWTLDVLLTLADRGVIDPVWSEKVLGEARDAIYEVHGTKGGARYVAEAARAYPYAAVEVDEGDCASLELPDSNDRHVIAGALAGRCGLIVTYNVRDFPDEVLAPMGLRAVRPDDFLMEVATSDPGEAVAAVRALVAAKRYPPRSMEKEVEGLRANMLNRFADFVEEACGAC